MILSPCGERMLVPEPELNWKTQEDSWKGEGLTAGEHGAAERNERRAAQKKAATRCPPLSRVAQHVTPPSADEPEAPDHPQSSSCPSAGILGDGERSSQQISEEVSHLMTWNRPARHAMVDTEGEARTTVATGRPSLGSELGFGGAIFFDEQKMKEKLKERLTKKEYSVFNYYKTEGCWQAVARSTIFDYLTLFVIFFNALWIGFETDVNKKELLLEAHPVFIAGENFFAVYFTGEVLIRFMAFKDKFNCLKDAWFIFDSFLVVFTIAETWGMMILTVIRGSSGGGGLGDASILRIAKLLRLSRMARITRLLRAMPELMTLIKGIVASIRSVFLTLCLLFIFLYVFGILFTQLMREQSEEVFDLFSSVPASMMTLLIDGVFLDNMGDLMRLLGKTHLAYGILFFLFILLASLTMMNMLIGVVCELVSAVAATEKEQRLLLEVKEKMHFIMTKTGADENQDNLISKTEFLHLLDRPEAVNALSEVGVDVIGLVDYVDFIFASENDEGGEERQLTFSEFMTLMLQLRGSNNATVRDVVDLRKFVQTRLKKIEEKLMRKILSRQNSIGSPGGFSRQNSTLPPDDPEPDASFPGRETSEGHQSSCREDGVRKSSKESSSSKASKEEPLQSIDMRLGKLESLLHDLTLRLPERHPIEEVPAANRRAPRQIVYEVPRDYPRRL